MNKLLSVLLLSTLPVLSFAADHKAGSMADMHANMPGMEHGMEHGMAGMQHEAIASASGEAGDPAKVSRTIVLSMNDAMRFTPSKLVVKEGETIRFFIKNTGTMTHEMVIGEMSELKEHAEMMRKIPSMKHASANMVTINAGQSGGIVWQFGKAGVVDFACLIPGHMEAGMTGKVMVE
ncbi:MAG: putative cupredoxin-like copper-binding protein [Candidatus Paceibacteria bacterium]|jgi:uncharacterized cupredoxin-like copper-binding protein